MKKNLFSLALIVTILISISCKKDNPSKPDKPDKPNGGGDVELGIESVIPPSLGDIYVNNFNRYTKVVAPNGGAIHIVAQTLITDEQIVRCRSILEHYLADLKGSVYGANKSSIANNMANRKSVLCLLNGQDDESNPVAEQVEGQPLFQNEIQVEGGSWYMTQNYDYRDAAFEEILHFVHDNGIGIDGDSEYKPVGLMVAFQAEIRAAQENAVEKKIWYGDEQWMIDLAKENSLTQEYLAAVIDAYYGLWGAWTDNNVPESETHSMWGFYMPKVRGEIEDEDPEGNKLMTNKFLHPYLTYNARIDTNLDGVFSLRFDKTKPYTNASQYLKDITLLGSNDNSVVVNELNNDITGNKGKNTVIFSGKKSEYDIDTKGDITTVTDTIVGRDGENELQEIEYLQFSDETVAI